APAFAQPPAPAAKPEDALAEKQNEELSRDETVAARKDAAGGASDRSLRLREGRAERSFATAEQSRFARLSASVPRTASALRARRAEWGECSHDFTSGAHPSEARGRGTRDGAPVSDPADLEQTRADAAAYLARADAVQSARVRAVLESLSSEKP